MSDYMAHGFCFSWEPGLVWLHVASDIVTGLAYYVITAAMGYFAYKRRDVPFMWVFLLFALFIVACGTTHFFAAYTVYRPEYWPEGIVKGITAFISIVAAIVFIPKIPQAILMPSLAKTLGEVQRLGAEQQRGKERLQSLVNVFQYEAKSIQDLLDFALNEAITMTASRFGYIYYFDEKTEQFTLNSWSRGVMPACSVTNPQTLYHLEKTGIWGEAVRQRKPIIINDFAAPDPLKKGYPEGHVHLTRFMTIPLFDHGKIVAVVGAANKEAEYDDSDVTQLTLLMESVWKVVERRRAEDELKQKNEELERFIYTVSHDLKSPLVTISAFLGYLESDIKSGDQVRIDKDIGYIRTASDKMSLLLSELLELSRVGRGPVHVADVRLDDIVQEALQMVAGAISERGVVVTVAESPLVLSGVKTRLVEVWQNLIENAVKYMGDQEKPQVEIGYEQALDETVFFVRDNGIGINTRYHENIFGLFNQLDVGSEGSGLGLALVKRIVETCNGRIWVESAGVGHGSCFRFTLPAALIKQGYGAAI
jgi:signal transduction histidine kinase